MRHGKNISKTITDGAIELQRLNIELTARIAELERRNAMLNKVLRPIVSGGERSANEVDDGCLYCEVSITDIKAARKALSATPADTEAWIQAEIVKRLGEPVAEIEENEYGGRRTKWYDMRGAALMLFGTKLYRLPEPLATPEERKD